MTWALLPLVLAGWPELDPGLSPAELADRGRQPNDPAFRADGPGCGATHLFSFTPTCAAALDGAERSLGTGIHADRAWLWTPGRPDVTLAILDGGLDLASPELAGRVALNPGEIPPPPGGPHDRNGDGAFTVLDFADAATGAPTIDRVVDPRLLARADRGDANGNGILDPLDLRLVFADGRDDDGNGLVDDLAGYDFVDRDGDPSGAASEATLAAAEGDNRVGGVGVCPRCTILPLRIADDAGARLEAVGEALRYAVGRAEVAAVLALPATRHPALDRRVAEAIDGGLAIVAPSGREGGFGGDVRFADDDVLVVGAVGPGAGGAPARPDAATTFFLPDPYGSFGPALDLVVPAATDRGAAAMAAGALGLVLSVAHGLPGRGIEPLAPPLGPRELYALLEESAVLPSGETAWRPRLGRGRLELRRAIDRLIAREIPPVVRVRAPAPFSLFDPSPGAPLPIELAIDARRGAAAYTIELALGQTPDAERFALVASGTVAGEARRVHHAPASALRAEDPTRPPHDRDDGFVTLRVSARRGDVTRVERGFVRSHRDLYAWPGTPRRVGSAVRALAIADLGHGPRVLVGTGDGHVLALDADGAPVAGFPVETPGLAPVAGLAVGVDPDGAAYVVATTDAGDVLQVGPAEREAPGFFTRVGGRWPSAPALADLDGDAGLEITLTTADGRWWLLDDDGRVLQGRDLGQGPLGPPAIGDLDGDGRPEVVVPSHTHLHWLDPLGRPPPDGWPRALDPLPEPPGGARPGGAVLADVDGDDQLELAVAPLGRAAIVLEIDDAAVVRMDGSRGGLGPGSDLDRGGPPLFALAKDPVAGRLRIPAGVDLVTALAPEPVAFSRPGPFEAAIAGHELPRGDLSGPFPRRVYDRGPVEPLVLDVDGDRVPELVFADGRERVEAIGRFGLRARGFPKLVPGRVRAMAAGELFGDGRIALVVGTETGDLFVFRTEAEADQADAWTTARHDLQRTANLDARPPEADREPAPSCHALGGGGLTAALLALGLAVRRARARLALLGLLSLGGCATALGVEPRSFAELDYGFPGGRTVEGRRARARIFVSELPGPPGAARLPVILLHPWGTNLSIWSEVAPSLAAERRVVLLDLPGHGKSSKPPSRYPVRRMAVAVLDVMEALGLERAILVGNSLGGATALETAIIAPERAAALALIGAPGGEPIPDFVRRTLSSFASERNLATVSDEALGTGWGIVSLGLGPPALRMLRDQLAVRRSREWRAFSHAAASALVDAAGWRPEVESIRVPALVIQGGLDPVVWPWSGRRLAERLPAGRLVELGGCGHCPELDCPREVLSALAGFLAGLP